VDASTPFHVFWLVVRLSYGEMTYIEEWDSPDKCATALQRLENLNRSVDQFRCVIEFSLHVEPMSTMLPPMLGSPEPEINSKDSGVNGKE
jgi:hypothetical protein